MTQLATKSKIFFLKSADYSCAEAELLLFTRLVAMENSSFSQFLRRLTARSAAADLLLLSSLVAMTNSSSSSSRRMSHDSNQPLVLSI
jgi:hypothetical protein